MEMTVLLTLAFKMTGVYNLVTVLSEGYGSYLVDCLVTGLPGGY